MRSRDVQGLQDFRARQPAALRRVRAISRSTPYVRPAPRSRQLLPPQAAQMVPPVECGSDLLRERTRGRTTIEAAAPLPATTRQVVRDATRTLSPALPAQLSARSSERSAIPRDWRAE